VLIENNTLPLSHATTNKLYMRTTTAYTRHSNERTNHSGGSPLDVARKRRLKLIMVDMSSFTAVNTDDKFQQQWTLCQLQSS